MGGRSLTDRRRYEKVSARRSEAEYKAWGKANTRCHCCGIDEDSAASIRMGLTTHHIVRKFRASEPCVLLRLCWSICHMAAEGSNVVLPSGIRVPNLSQGHCMWLKRERCPAEWDPDRLAAILGHALPEIERPPDFFFSLRARHGASTS